jgi:hypothetical protein
VSKGVFTPYIAAKMELYFGRASSQRELRLLPYLQHVLINDGYIDQRRINDEERAILVILAEEGHIQQWMPTLSVTKQFWDFIAEILWDSYVPPSAK